MFGAIKLYAIIGAVVGLVGALTASHMWVYSRGKEHERVAALERSIALIKERSETNEEVSKLSDAELCVELGGVWVPDGQGGSCQ